MKMWKKNQCLNQLWYTPIVFPIPFSKSLQSNNENNNQLNIFSEENNK